MVHFGRAITKFGSVAFGRHWVRAALITLPCHYSVRGLLEVLWFSRCVLVQVCVGPMVHFGFGELFWNYTSGGKVFKHLLWRQGRYSDLFE